MSGGFWWLMVRGEWINILGKNVICQEFCLSLLSLLDCLT